MCTFHTVQYIPTNNNLKFANWGLPRLKLSFLIVGYYKDKQISNFEIGYLCENEKVRGTVLACSVFIWAKVDSLFSPKIRGRKYL